MGAIAIRCPECGATIPAPESSHVATCSYCGTRSQIRRRTRFLEIPQPPAKLPGPALPMAMQQHSRRWVVGMFVLPMIIGGVLAFSMFLHQAVTGNTYGPASLREPGWDGIYGAALVDVDGDGTIDIVGRAEVIQPEHLGLIGAWHGTTGKRMWITASLGPRSDLIQAPLGVVGKVVITSDGLAGVSAYNLADGTPLWSIRLNEKVAQFCAGAEGFVHVRTADDRLHPLRIVDGALQPAGGAGPCTPVPGAGHRGDREAWDVWGSLGARSMVPGTKIEGLNARTALHHRATGRTIALGEKAPGTRVPMIAAFRWPGEEAVDVGALERQARATRDRVERDRLRAILRDAETSIRERKPEVQWIAQVPGVDPLSVSEGTPDPQHAALDGDGVVVVYGTRKTHQFRVAAFAMGDGRRLWDVEIPGDDPMTTIVLSPTHALVSRWSGLYALDRTTGQLAFVIR